MELDMTKGSPFKLIMKFMVPLIIGNIFQQLYNMADTIIVGRYVGTGALAAVGSTGTIMFLIIGFMQGMTTGFTILTSQRFGSGDIEGLKKSVGNAAVLSIIVTVIGTFISVAGMDGLLKLMNTPPDIFQDAKDYITIICIGLVANILYNLLASILRAVGNSKVPLYFLVVAAILNVVLDLVFIIQFKMGVSGAAWATVISQGVSGVLCLIYIMKKVSILHIGKEDWKLDYYCVRNQLSIGIPMAVQFSITAIGTILVQSALNILGSVAVAAYTAAGKVEQFVTQPFLALGMTMATYCAQNTGINDIKRIRAGVLIANIMSAIYGVVIAFVVVFAMPHAIKLFIVDDAAMITEYAKTYIGITSVFFIPLGMIFIFRNVLQGCGYSFVPIMGGIVELASRAVLAVLAASLMSFTGVCFANAAAWITAGLYLWISYLYTMRKWERKQTIFQDDTV